MNSIKMGKIKNIALIAHDNKKDDLLEWACENKVKLGYHNLSGTNTTAKIISEGTDLEIFRFKNGPLGGDQQVGAGIVNGTIDFIIFFWDPLTSQPHDPDVKALLRIAVLYDIPIAMNRSTADFLLMSPLMDIEYNRDLKDNTNLK